MPLILDNRNSLGTGVRFTEVIGPIARGIQILREKHDRNLITLINKSAREEDLTGESLKSQMSGIKKIIEQGGVSGTFYFDGDHANEKTLERFNNCEYLTLDVADALKEQGTTTEANDFISNYKELLGKIKLPGINEVIDMSLDDLFNLSCRYIPAANQVKKLYNKAKELRGNDTFMVEVSIDETDKSQTPKEMLVMLALLSDMGVPIQAIAPKLHGEFYKGLDHHGDPMKCLEEYRLHLAVAKYAVQEFGMPESLRISMHSGSDKWTIYDYVRGALLEQSTHAHVKTAGTHWLAQVEGLAQCGPDPRKITANLYEKMYYNIKDKKPDDPDSLAYLYQTVVAKINLDKMPTPKKVYQMGGAEFAELLVKNPHVRMGMHIAYQFVKGMPVLRGAMQDQRNRQIIDPIITNNVIQHGIHAFPSDSEYGIKDRKCIFVP